MILTRALPSPAYFMSRTDVFFVCHNPSSLIPQTCVPLLCLSPSRHTGQQQRSPGSLTAVHGSLDIDVNPRGLLLLSFKELLGKNQ